jgi:hypothetical protein
MLITIPEMPRAKLSALFDLIEKSTQIKSISAKIHMCSSSMEHNITSLAEVHLRIWSVSSHPSASKLPTVFHRDTRKVS